MPRNTSRPRERLDRALVARGLAETREQAEEALRAAFPYPEQNQITFTDPGSGHQWVYSLADLGLSFDVETTLDALYSRFGYCQHCAREAIAFLMQSRYRKTAASS